MVLSNEQGEHAPGALGGVGDGQVVDVDVEVSGQAGEFGQHPLAVRDGDPQLGQAVGPGGSGRQGAAGRAGPAQELEQAGPIGPGNLGSQLGEVGQQAVQPGHDGLGVLGADVAPDVGLAGGDPGYVPEPAGGQAQQGAVGPSPVGGCIHEGGGDQVGHVGHHRHQPVVVLGGKGGDVGPE